MQKRISTLAGIIIIVAAALVVFGGVFAYQFFFIKSAWPTIVNRPNLLNLSVCGKDSDCVDTCCGCMSKNIKCAMDCISQIPRNCECKNNQCTEKRTISINTKEEAIEFAKNDKDFIQAANKFKSEFSDRELLYNAYFDDEKKLWDVDVWPEGTFDLWYFIKFDNQGKIIEKGYGKGS